MRPHTSYMICAVDRSGTGLICDALRATGIGGNPLETIDKGQQPHYYRTWGVSNFSEYLRRLIEEGTTSNGVFGVRLNIFEGGLWEFIEEIQQLADYRGRRMSPPELLEAVFPNLHYIWVLRVNKVRQAISHLKAMQTGFWASSHELTRKQKQEPEFDFAALEKTIAEFVLQDAAWAEFFTTYGISPFTIVYEDFAIRYEEAALQILEHLKVSIPLDFCFNRETVRKKQSDATNDAWAQQYRELRQQGWQRKSW